MSEFDLDILDGPGKRLTQAERAALSDSRMFAAAIALIDKQGTHNTTLKDVSEYAGYSRSMASSRFGSKESLFLELQKKYSEIWQRHLATAVGESTGLDAFVSANRGVISFYEKEERFVRVMYIISYELIGSSEEMKNMLKRRHEIYRTAVVRWMEEGIEDGSVKSSVDPEKIAKLYNTGIFGSIFQWLINSDGFDLSEALADLREDILELVQT